jgi:hypothetical protein
MLVALLRLTGAAMLSALVFVFCPFDWMRRIHEAVDMGPLEYTPLLSYLTRTLSAMYVIVGAVLLFVSRDVDRYRPLIRLLGLVAIAGGVGVTVLDAIEHLPILWTVAEGPLTVLLGVVLLFLCRKQIQPGG